MRLSAGAGAAISGDFRPMVQIRQGFFVSTGILAVNQSINPVIMGTQPFNHRRKYDGKDDRKIQPKV